MDTLTDDDEWNAGLLVGPTIEVKLLDSGVDAGLIEGYGATFHGVDSHNDTIVPGAFTETLAQHKAAGTAPAMLWSHRQSEPIGRWTAMGEDARGLRVRGQLNLESQAGQKAHAHLKAGDITGLSPGYQVPPGGASPANNRGRVLTRMTLHEVSTVAIPSDNRARVLQVKSLELKSAADLESLLREAGLPRGAAKKIAGPGFSALAGDPEAPPHDPALIELVNALDRNVLDLKSLKGKF